MTDKLAMYSSEPQKGATYRSVCGEIPVIKAFDSLIGEANTIREQVAELAKLAEHIRERLEGSRPECDGCANAETPAGGVIGELQRVQAGTINSIADARRALEQIGRLV